nr:MAG TPA: hypothetical protein [Caudoviricetes sp.]
MLYCVRIERCSNVFRQLYILCFISQEKLISLFYIRGR